MSNYRFTEDWFSPNIPIWELVVRELAECDAILEVGSYEGRSTVWLLENALSPSGTLTAIDTWEGGEEHRALGTDMGSVEDRFDHNIAVTKTQLPNQTVTKLKGTSFEHLRQLPLEAFNLAYVDGSHTARDVLSDACLTWPLLKPGAFLIFDDYLWGNPRDALHRPKLAIDSFINVYAEELSLFHIGNQLTLRKTK
jgi:predicted O-methyltransferase YrrM